MKKLLLSLILLVLIFGFAYASAVNFVPNPSNNQENFFKIEKNLNPPHSAFKQFAKYVNVFGVKIYAMADVRDIKLLHAANVLAQYLDNDEDGQVDNPKVLQAMLDHKVYVIMVKTGDSPDLRKFFKAGPPRDWEGQDLYDEETHPNGAAQGLFDASLEELLHIVTHAGYAYAYPEVFGENEGTEVAKALDAARGGHFLQVPEKYPNNAWFTYYDKTCDYSCQITEYIYWALTSILGAQDFPGRFDYIKNEWRLNTKEKVKNGDPTIYKLLTDPRYGFPTKLPDGTYRR